MLEHCFHVSPKDDDYIIVVKLFLLQFQDYMCVAGTDWFTLSSVVVFI
jgi:hypothetical protein